MVTPEKLCHETDCVQRVHILLVHDKFRKVAVSKTLRLSPLCERHGQKLRRHYSKVSYQHNFSDTGPFESYNLSHKFIPLTKSIFLFLQVEYLKSTLMLVSEQELSSCWDGRSFGHNSHGPKSGGLLCPFLWGELGPHLTQCRLGWSLPPYQVVSWSIQLFGHNTHGLKSGGLLCAFPWGGELTMSPGSRPTFVPSGIFIHPTIWPQYTNVTDRQDNGPAA